MIYPLSLKNIIEKVEKNEKCFFEALSKLIFHENEINNINEVEISLSEANNEVVGNVYTISLHMILNKIADFATFTKYANEKDTTNEIASLYSERIELHTTSKSIENKYGEEFDSYLCSYLLYYLIEEMQNTKKIKKVKIHNYKTGICNREDTYQTTFFTDKASFTKEYNVNYSVMDKILKKLFKDKPLDNVKYECS